MKVLCVLNPLAASGEAMQRWPAVRLLLQSMRLDHELLATHGSIEDCVAERMAAPDGADFCVIAGVGGDGTHSAVLNALMRVQQLHPGRALPPYAFIPLGTGNDLAKSLGFNIPENVTESDLRRAVSAIAHGADYRLDLGVFGGRYFADALTLGLDSQVLRVRNAQKRRLDRIPVLRRFLRGRLLYTLSLSGIIFSQRRMQVTVQVDGHPWYEGPLLNLVINNTRIYGGVFDLSPEAYADDGLLDAVLFTGPTDYLARYLVALRFYPERARQRSVDLLRVASHIQGAAFEIRVSHPCAVQVDGEELPDAEHFEIGVRKRAIAIRTPVEP